LITANGDIEQSGGPITAAAVSAVALNGAVELTDSSNAVAVIAGSANGALGFTLVNSGDFSVGVVPGFGLTSAVSGITSSNSLGAFGVVLQTPATGTISVAAPIDAGSAGVLVGAAGGVVQETDGLISAGYLHVNASSAAGIGSSNAPLRTAVSTLRSANSSGPVHISNGGDLQINFILAPDAVNVNASGSLTTPTEIACDCTRSISGSSVVLAASGPMLLSAGAEITATDGVELYAGYDSASETYTSSRTLTVDSNVSGSTIGLFAGGAITTSGTLTGVVTESPLLYAGAPSSPSLAQCIATPVLPGCSSVLPSLAECTATPSTPGCSAVLPTLAVCVVSPATAGCSVVLPTLAVCTADPTAAGCSAVLPTLAACTADPAAAGCSAVLPTLAVCVVSPATVGCSVVLPTLAMCTANPAAAGCSAVLPSLAACVASPTTSGCSVVLPSLAQCSATPTLAGCSTVLPAVTQCLANPASAGCAVILPPQPVYQASNEVIRTINTVASMNGDKQSGSLVPTSTTPVNTAAVDKKVEDKKSAADDKLDANKDTKAVKDEPIKKTYCN
jgi:hypothetical protein